MILSYRDTDFLCTISKTVRLIFSNEGQPTYLLVKDSISKKRAVCGEIPQPTYNYIASKFSHIQTCFPTFPWSKSYDYSMNKRVWRAKFLHIECWAILKTERLSTRGYMKSYISGHVENAIIASISCMFWDTITYCISTSLILVGNGVMMANFALQTLLLIE